MIDLSVEARLLILADAAVTAAGLPVYVGDYPPEEWDPSGSAAVVKSRGGPVTYPGLFQSSLQIKAYGPDQVAATAAYNLIHDALHEKRSARVLWSVISTTGTLLRDPVTGRIFMLGYADQLIREV